MKLFPILLLWHGTQFTAWVSTSHCVESPKDCWPALWPLGAPVILPTVPWPQFELVGWLAVYTGSKQLPVKDSKGKAVSHFGYECALATWLLTFTPPPPAHSLMERKLLWQAKEVATSGILRIVAIWRRWCYTPLGLAAFIVCLFIIFTALGFRFYRILWSLHSEQFHSSGGVKQFGGYLEVILVVNFQALKILVPLFS